MRTGAQQHHCYVFHRGLLLSDWEAQGAAPDYPTGFDIAPFHVADDMLFYNVMNDWTRLRDGPFAPGIFFRFEIGEVQHPLLPHTSLGLLAPPAV